MPDIIIAGRWALGGNFLPGFSTFCITWEDNPFTLVKCHPDNHFCFLRIGVVLVGHSMGCAVSLQYMELFGQDVRKPSTELLARVVQGEV